jgi:hypothetical protein
MLTAVLLMGVLLIAAALLLDSVHAVTVDTQMLDQKDHIFDAAEAGLDTAADLLARIPTATSGCPGGTLQSITFTCGIGANNLSGATPLTSVTDPVTGNSITIPKGEGLIWGKATTALGGRTVWAEAIVSVPIVTFNFPPGAINAGSNVTGGGHMTVNSDPTDLLNPHDADVHANGNVTSFTTSVQGATYAVGSDSQAGWNGATNPGSPAVSMPSTGFVTAFTTYSYNQAFNLGTRVQPSAMTGTKTFTGNVYIGNTAGTRDSGNLDLTSGTFTFNGGIVFVDGYLCMSGHAKIVSNLNTIFVVREQFAQAGNSSSFGITTGTKGILAALGADTTPACSAANGSYAASDSGNGSEDLGLVWTPNGSTLLSGNGNITGSIMAGVNAVLNGGGSSGEFIYDKNLVTAAVSAPVNIKILSFGEVDK